MAKLKTSHLLMNGNDRLFACGRPFKEELINASLPVCLKCTNHTTRAVVAERVPFLDGKNVGKWVGNIQLEGEL